jgi:hypothetical protein
MVFGAELQRDWSRLETVPGIGQVGMEHQGNVGTNFLWEQQLLDTEPQRK